MERALLEVIRPSIFEVRESFLEGRGCFAARSIQEGEVIKLKP